MKLALDIIIPIMLVALAYWTGLAIYDLGYGGFTAWLVLSVFAPLLIGACFPLRSLRNIVARIAYPLAVSLVFNWACTIGVSVRYYEFMISHGFIQSDAFQRSTSWIPFVIGSFLALLSICGWSLRISMSKFMNRDLGWAEV